MPDDTDEIVSNPLIFVLSEFVKPCIEVKPSSDIVAAILASLFSRLFREG